MKVRLLKNKKDNKKLVRKKKEVSKKAFLKSKEKTILEKLKLSQRKKKLIILALILSIFINCSLGAHQYAISQIREEEIKTHQEEIDEINQRMVDLTEELKAGKVKESEYEEKIKSLEKEKNELNEKLQAKLNSIRTSNAVAASSNNVNIVQGSCTEWIKAAGITDINNAYTLVMRESGCRVNARNASSGAYGIPQALPGNKMASAGADWETNPITQLKWMDGYVKSRYGSWAGAVSFWNQYHWY